MLAPLAGRIYDHAPQQNAFPLGGYNRHSFERGLMNATPVCVGSAESISESPKAWSFAEAASAFEDPLSVTIRDPLHSESEERFVLIGLSRKRHLVVVAHVERGDIIRIISARIASRAERRTYEEG